MVRNRDQIHAPVGYGEKIADGVVSGMGSWRFIIIQTAIVAIWIASNLWMFSHPFDMYPFILLNLLFSTQAAYASPLILMSQNRQARKDATRDDLEAQEVQALFESHELLMKLNEQQLEILRLLQEDQKGKL